MPRPVTLFTGQWADLPLEVLAEKAAGWGYDGLELACWGDHFEVDKALEQDGYIQSRHDILEKHGLHCYAISNHLVGQAVSDPIDTRHKSIVPPRIWGDGTPNGVQARAAEEMANTARAARMMGVNVVNGFTGSPVWHMLYFFPPTPLSMIEEGYARFGEQWKPILGIFQENDVRFALEVHPTEIAYDIYTSEKALEAVNHHRAFGFNFDPSHLVHQQFDPVNFINRFPDRIYHVHVKDTKLNLNGHNSILSSHLNFGDSRRGWDFVSPGHGDVQFGGIMRALNRINYQGPLSVEWEDIGMDREHGAAEAAQFVKKMDFKPSTIAFDAAFEK